MWAIGEPFVIATPILYLFRVHIVTPFLIFIFASLPAISRAIFAFSNISKSAWLKVSFHPVYPFSPHLKMTFPAFEPAKSTLGAEHFTNSQKRKMNPPGEDLRSVEDRIRTLLSFSPDYHFRAVKCSSSWDFLLWWVQPLIPPPGNIFGIASFDRCFL